MLPLLQAIILGIIEGVTEFLPISSTGHLIVTQKMMNFHDKNELFTVVIQLGAIAAVVWYYRDDLLQKTIGLFKRDKAALNFWLILAIGTVPAGLFGLLLDSTMAALTIPFYVAVSLIIGGIILWFVDRRPAHERAPKTDLATISKKQAILVGIGQAIAIIPGISRSGASIVTGLATGLNRPTATAFSFYLSIPVMILASGYKLIKYYDQVPQVTGGWPALLLGLSAAFVTALFAIKWLLRYIARHNFRIFAIYRIVLGFVLLLLIAAGILI